ncbi:hypothetical protein [Hymenobacter elongatus]|uniref:Lipoprotein n=1 Tax=Hymenobacter elongatus TaxID=877208 RepID=A0A4Z0PM12_9BACT|nr:hypothetical protein [Hymenobacter elongatus]TGE16448.1 hypothetical protein E5J99_09995 [Hymenobacter elongatus]
MKLRFTWVFAVGLGALSLASCSEKQAARDLTVQPDVTAQAGQVISSAQAVEWTHRFQKTHPNEMWDAFTDATIFNGILDQKGCLGLRIYHAVNKQGNNTFVLVGVNAVGDMTDGDISDESPTGPPHPFNSILVSTKIGEQKLLPVLKGGALIPVEQAADMTRTYRKLHPQGVWAGYFSAKVYRNLLAQPGCIGLRVYKGLKEGNEECFVMVGVNQAGADITEGEVYDMALPCPPNQVASRLMQ